MFKERSSKKRIHVIDNTKEASTLDEIHTNTINRYHEVNERINALKTQLEKYDTIKIDLMNEIKGLEDVTSDYSQELWDSNVRIKDIIIDLKENLERLQNNKTPTNAKSVAKTNEEKKKKNILDALNINTDNIPQLKNNEGDKSTLVNEYLSLTDNKYISYVSGEFTNDACPNCNDTTLTTMQYDAVIICLNCGYQEVLLVEQNRPVMVHDKKDNSHYSYKRINHFREWINQIQGKESTDIPNEVFERILNELKKEKITNTKELTYKTMRNILKKLKINKYYEHINYIINRINGVPTPQFSPELEEKLCNMFKEIQGPFLKHCPSNRKNFLSYSYVLYKLCQILGQDEFLKHFPLLKSRIKIFQMDLIWKNICESIGYPFIPSI
eukprot:762478-Hanusia_phi.AAC.4